MVLGAPVVELPPVFWVSGTWHRDRSDPHPFKVRTHTGPDLVPSKTHLYMGSSSSGPWCRWSSPSDVDASSADRTLCGPQQNKQAPVRVTNCGRHQQPPHGSPDVRHWPR